jgi:hypothetical protein
MFDLTEVRFVKRFVIGSDNCTGQNKNGLLIRFVWVTVTVHGVY